MPLSLTPSQTAPKLDCFGRYAERACESGFLPIPMNGKKPMLSGWNSRPLGRRAIANLLDRMPQIAGANIGFRTGKLVAIDIDHDVAEQSQRIAHIVRGALGDTSFVRIGQPPRQMLFYRSIEPIASTSVSIVDVLGAGKVATVAGMHPGTGRPYLWFDESLLDVDFCQVPLTSEEHVKKLVRWLKDDVEASKEALGRHLSRSAMATASLLASARAGARVSSGLVIEGQRNNTLFRRLLEPARTARSYAALVEIAERENARFSPPMLDEEVEQVARSVWSYRRAGRLLVRGRQAVMLPIDKDGVLDLTPEAVYLLAILRTTRTGKTFTIPQRATARHLGWGSDRVRKAIIALVSAGHIRVVRKTFHAQTDYEWGTF